MPGGVQRRDSIIRMLRFIKLFYRLEPLGSELTITQIQRHMHCSRTNVKHCIDAAGFEIPITETGVDTNHTGRGPAGITYGVLK